MLNEGTDVLFFSAVGVFAIGCMLFLIFVGNAHLLGTDIGDGILRELAKKASRNMNAAACVAIFSYCGSYALPIWGLEVSERMYWLAVSSWMFPLIIVAWVALCVRGVRATSLHSETLPPSILDR